MRDDLIKTTNAVVLRDSLNIEDFSGKISTDTRTIEKGDIYLPLKGANFNGELFIKDAIDAGAVGYFTTEDTFVNGANLILKVENTLMAYLAIAQNYRHKVNPITVAITGSSGKTTTKELVYSVMSVKFKTHKTFSNHNNEIGFCQTVLSMPDNTEALIVEMGMRGLGEIELISNNLNPNYGIITNCGTAHIGRLGSENNIAKAKCEIVSGMNSDGMLIALNQDITKRNLDFCGKKVFYSLRDVEILKQEKSYSQFMYKGKTYELFVDGVYNIENSLAAIELGLALGMTCEEICLGLASYKPIEKRWEIDEINGIKFINDSYNANPESMKASVKTFVDLYENPVVVLGNMGELGENEVEYHKQVGQYLSKLNKKVKYLTVGDLAKKIGEELRVKGFEVQSFSTNSEVSCYILENLNEGYTIFLKASRSMKFEEIIDKVRGI